MGFNRKLFPKCTICDYKLVLTYSFKGRYYLSSKLYKNRLYILNKSSFRN